MPRSLSHQGIVNQGLGRCIDPVHHVGGFGGVDCPFTVWADRHAFRLDTHVDLANNLAAFSIDNGDHGGVFVGDVQPAVVRVQGKLLGVLSRGEVVGDSGSFDVKHLDSVRVAGANVECCSVVTQGDAPWPKSHVNGVNHLQRVDIDHRQRIVFFIRHPGGFPPGTDCADKENKPQPNLLCPTHDHEVAPENGQLTSGASKPRVSSSVTGWRNPGCGLWSISAFALTRAMG